MSDLMRGIGLGGALAALVSCAPAGRVASAPGSPLTYAAPEGTGFRFVRNAALSCPGQVVLDLVGPDAHGCRGVAFTLHAGAEVAWEPPVPGRGYLENLAFDLGPGAPLLQSAVSGFRFNQNAGLSTPTRLVLDLMGPETQAGRGVAFTLAAGPGVAWDPMPAGGAGFLENVAFDLGSGIALLKTAVTGGTLQAMVFQKGPGGARALGGPICRVALVGSGGAPGTIPLTVTTFQVLPATGGALHDAPCELGTLVAQ